MQTIGKYQVEKVLGRGGMGTVYQALDPVIHRRVAVKTMIPDLAETPDLRARFLREAQAAGGLRHRNIVTVYDLGEDKGQPYIAMEFIEGTDLERIIQQREPYPIEWKLDVIRQVCEGLGYAHRNGIVHRDIKPANIRVTPEGEVKIMDFGIAHLQSSTMTKSGLVLGTVHYMAPEQVEGHKVDHRADIFSVGAIAYELIAYKRPWDGDSLTAVMFKIMRESPDFGSLPASDYSPGLEAIISKALAKSVLERYQSLEEMRDELETLVRSTAARLMKKAPAVPPEPAPSTRLNSLLEEVRRRLALGEAEEALFTAREAIALAPEDAGAKAALREAESEGLKRRVEREMSDIRAEMERAQTDGHLQKALGLCRRLLELDPDDEGLVSRSQAIEGAIREREVEQLSSMALSYAADGDMDLAQKIAAKISRLAPDNPRAAQLRKYMEEEMARRAAEALTATAQEHLAHGNLEEARAAAEEALAVQPAHSVALEIRDRASAVLAVRTRAHDQRQAEPDEPPAETVRMPALAPEVAARVAADHHPAPVAEAAPVSVAAVTPPPVAVTPPPVAAAPPPVQVTPPPAAPAESPVKVAAVVAPPLPVTMTPPPVTITPPPVTPTPVPVPSPTPPPGLDTTTLSPLPEGPPSNPEAAALLETARRLLRERLPQKALPLLEQALALEPGHQALKRVVELARLDARRSEAASLTASALNHFMQNNYGKARKAVDKALALEPENKRAKELVKILAALS